MCLEYCKYLSIPANACLILLQFRIAIYIESQKLQLNLNQYKCNIDNNDYDNENS